MSAELHGAMLASIASVHSGQKHLHSEARKVALRHPIFWMVDRPSDLPAWMLTGDGIRQVPVPRPDLELRSSAGRVLIQGIPGWLDLPDEPAREHAVTTLAESTEGLSLRAMVEVVQLARDVNSDVSRIDDSVRTYRLGLTDNPWQKKALTERIRTGEELLSKWVMGQPRAVRKTLDLLVRSATGLTGAHQRRPGTGPRGVLFFTGPTGVGKTELAKAITHLVFGDERAFVRFDMSEFSSEHSEARLLGSPPGYVGHGGGGELTNAVRRRPFTLLLFDEIEKAHDRIMDKFLQILSDGRLTDGSGDTVHFSESIIVFTSNLGATNVDVSGLPEEEQASAFEIEMRTSVERHFNEELHRPELYGRIGDSNVVVFQPMRHDIARNLAANYLRNVTRRLHEQLSITLSIEPDVEEAIISESTRDLKKGGRGISMALESMYVNPLARAVFEREGQRQLSVIALGQDRDGSPTVVLR
ncbi:AAA family ATPase [Glutamicibacter protophormiae]|uniref:AAA family ATPase n=2 Tax=Glutamicibacter protophormiae TaxID=37930 RepID=UPI002A81B909|nr:AAA family ATPase [Glutamicibacter protophormiae]WPR67122.1 AAA family ATPase [Glutamicibacter protophormiae]